MNRVVAPPRLTLIVPAWNAAATIEDAIESVLGQMEVPLECIVVDDSSTDGTLGIVSALAAVDPRVVVIPSPANAGPSAARNRALDVARGEWLAFLDADDRLLPGGLAAMLRAADANNALAVVGQRISTDGERTWIPTLYDKPDIRDPGRKSIATHPGLLYYAGPAGKLFRRPIAEGLRFEGRVLGDQPWVLRALLRAGDRIVVVSDVVYEWRRPHPDHYVPTITAARERSAHLAAEAVSAASTAFASVTSEIDRLVEPTRREPLSAAYFDRLILADLAHQLRTALGRADPDNDRLFRALGGFLAATPPRILAASEPLVGRILRPPLDAWRLLDRRARASYWVMVRPWLATGTDPRRIHQGRLVSRVVTLVARWNSPLTRFLAGLALSLSSRARSTETTRPPAG